MRTKFEFNKPDDLVATVSVTMSVKEFRELRKQLKNEWPSWKLGDAIGDVIRQAETVFYATEEPKDS